MTGKHRTDPNMKAIRIGHPPYATPSTDSTATSRFEPIDPEATSLLAPNELTTEETPSTELIRSSSDAPEWELSEGPTNPDLWGKDPHYDYDDRPQRALWAIVLCVVLALLIVGGVGFMFGAGVADTDEPVPVVTTTETKTVTSTPKPEARVRASAKTITKVGPTVFRTLPPKVVRVTSPPKVTTVTKTPRPLPRATVTKTIEVEIPGPVVTETIEIDAELSGRSSG